MFSRKQKFYFVSNKTLLQKASNISIEVSPFSRGEDQNNLSIKCNQLDGTARTAHFYLENGRWNHKIDSQNKSRYLIAEESGGMLQVLNAQGGKIENCMRGIPRFIVKPESLQVVNRDIYYFGVKNKLFQLHFPSNKTRAIRTMLSSNCVGISKLKNRMIILESSGKIWIHNTNYSTTVDQQEFKTFEEVCANRGLLYLLAWEVFSQAFRKVKLYMFDYKLKKRDEVEVKNDEVFINFKMVPSFSTRIGLNVIIIIKPNSNLSVVFSNRRIMVVAISDKYLGENGIEMSNQYFNYRDLCILSISREVTILKIKI